MSERIERPMAYRVWVSDIMSAACPVCGANHESSVKHDGVWVVPAPEGPRPPAVPPRPDHPVERASYPCVEGLDGDHYAPRSLSAGSGLGKGAAMTTIADIEARHVGVHLCTGTRGYGRPHNDDEQRPCDTAIVLAALREAQAYARNLDALMLEAGHVNLALQAEVERLRALPTRACPVCGGEGRVYRMTPAYEAMATTAAGGNFGWTGETHEWRTCHVCQGAGVLR